MTGFFQLILGGLKLFFLYISVLTLGIFWAMDQSEQRLQEEVVVAKDDKPCSYNVNISSTASKTIQKIKNTEYNTVGYYKDANQCIATFDAKIDGKWYIAEGSYIYGPDMAKADACKRAKQKAKVSIINQVSPEYVSSETIYSCKG